MKHALIAAAFVAFASAAAGQAAAQTNYTDPIGLYSYRSPAGWSRNSGQVGDSDVAWDAPGGMTRGGMFTGITGKRGSLRARIDEKAAGGSVIERRTLTVDGIPCELMSVQRPTIRETLMLCLIGAQFSDGWFDLEFYMGMVSPPEDAGWHMTAFNAAVATLNFGDGVQPAR